MTLSSTERRSTPAAGGSKNPARCEWCGRELPARVTAAAAGRMPAPASVAATPGGPVGRPRRYCAQACRQRAYENRNALQRGELPPDAVVLSADERNDLADRLYQVRCAAEDVATALAEGSDAAELGPLVQELLTAARSAERIR